MKPTEQPPANTDPAPFGGPSFAYTFDAHHRLVSCSGQYLDRGEPERCTVRHYDGEGRPVQEAQTFPTTHPNVNNP